MGKDVPFTSLNQEKQQLNYSFKRFLFTRHVILITENEFIKIFIKNDSRVFTVYFTFFFCPSCAFLLLSKGVWITDVPVSYNYFLDSILFRSSEVVMT